MHFLHCSGVFRVLWGFLRSIYKTQAYFLANKEGILFVKYHKVGGTSMALLLSSLAATLWNLSIPHPPLFPCKLGLCLSHDSLLAMADLERLNNDIDRAAKDVQADRIEPSRDYCVHRVGVVSAV